jgi:hypothetical protein
MQFYVLLILTTLMIINNIYNLLITKTNLILLSIIHTIVKFVMPILNITNYKTIKKQNRIKKIFKKFYHKNIKCHQEEDNQFKLPDLIISL